MTKKKPEAATPGKSSYQHLNQERTEQVSTNVSIQHKPFPPTSALVEAVELDENRGRLLEDIFAEIVANHEASELS